MLGIECDGATYHSARSARDRDRLRQQVLEGLGWTIHRIWSTDWFRNPQRELERVVASIERAKLSPSPPIPRVKVQPAVERTERTPQADIKARPYGMATIRVWLAQTELHMQPVYKLAEWVKQVVEVEGPVHIDEVARPDHQCGRLLKGWTQDPGSCSERGPGCGPLWASSKIWRLPVSGRDGGDTGAGQEFHSSCSEEDRVGRARGDSASAAPDDSAQLWHRPR